MNTCNAKVWNADTFDLTLVTLACEKYRHPTRQWPSQHARTVDTDQLSYQPPCSPLTHSCWKSSSYISAPQLLPTLPLMLAHLKLTPPTSCSDPLISLRTNFHCWKSSYHSPAPTWLSNSQILTTSPSLYLIFCFEACFNFIARFIYIVKSSCCILLSLWTSIGDLEKNNEISFTHACWYS